MIPSGNRSKSQHLTLFAGLLLIILVLVFGTAFKISSAIDQTPTTSPVLSSIVQSAPSQQGQAIFEQKCKSCHTIGGGKTVGPDLKGVTARRDRDWLIKFITAPDQLIAQGDPIAKQLVQEYGIPMPNLGVTQQQATEILAYIEAQSGGAPSAPAATPAAGQAPAAPKPETGQSASAVKGSADLGKNLFIGQTAMKNNGAACISCHDVRGVGALGGGVVGKDLTPAYSTFGEQGLTSMLKSPPFPIMKEAYADHPLTDDEIANIVAFLQEASAQGGQGQGQNPLLFVGIGIIGLIIIVAVFQLLWRRRLQGVRQSLVKGGSK